MTVLKYKIIERREIGLVLFTWRNQWPSVDGVDRRQDSAKNWDDKKGTEWACLVRPSHQAISIALSDMNGCYNHFIEKRP